MFLSIVALHYEQIVRNHQNVECNCTARPSEGKYVFEAEYRIERIHFIAIHM